MGSETRRAAFGGTLAARELWFGRSGSDGFYTSLWYPVTRVRGRIAFGAPCPQRSLAREASTLSLVTCHGGSSRRGIDPVGETSNISDTPLGTRHLVLTRPVSPNWRHPWSSQTKSRRSLPSQESQPTQRNRPSPASQVSGHFHPRPRFGSGAQCHQPGRGRNRRPFQHAYGLRPGGSRRQPSPPVRCQHRRSSRDRRMVEEVPYQDRRFGIHRRLLDCPVRASGIAGLRRQPGGTRATVALWRTAEDGRAGRPVDSTLAFLRSLAGRSGLPISCSRCVPTGGCGRCRSATPPVMSSTCRKPWSR